MNTEYLDRDDVLTVGTAACQFTPIVGDEGLLAAALARPRTTLYGLDAYPTIWDKAAALLHSIANNHALLDGNKRTAWAAAWLMIALNGEVTFQDFPGMLDAEAAEEFMLEASANKLTWQEISARLREFKP